MDVKERKIYLILVIVPLIFILLAGCRPMNMNNLVKESNSDGVNMDAKKESNSFLTYIKDDGLYYSDLKGKKEIKIHEGSNFEYPLISKSGDYIAYTKKGSLYIYDTEDKEYEKIADEINHYYISYDWVDESTIIYATKDKGFIVFDLSREERKERLDDYYYDSLAAANNIVYGRKENRWTKEEGDFASNEGIVEIDLSKYDLEKKKFETNIIIEGSRSTDEMIGYNPVVWKVREDGKYVFIMEKPASGSLSTDGIGLGIYDIKDRTHKKLEDLTSLHYKNHLAINPKKKNLVGLIEGAGREIIENKEVVLLDINEDKTYKIINFMDKDLVAMTPSFTQDGGKLLYSASKDLGQVTRGDETSIYETWEEEANNIYEYDIDKEKIRNLTDGNSFDFMPISISENSILFSRYKGDDYYSLIRLTDGKEELVVDNMVFKGGDYDYPFEFYGHIDTEKGMDIFINR